MSINDDEYTGSMLDSATLGTIAGRLTLDADKSGTEANGAGGWDAGIAGRVVQLLDLVGNVIATATTDAGGGYRFDVAAGQYVVKFPSLAGHTFAAMDQGSSNGDSDAGADGQTHAISLGAGELFGNIDASVQKLASGWITGRLTYDADGNNEEWAGTSGALDSGFSGRTVQLVDTAGNIVASTLTDASGNYWFEAGAGDYRVQFAESSGMGFVAQHSKGSSWYSDSDANANGLTDVISVVAGQTVSNIDAGARIADSGSIQGRFFMDENHNNLDDGEAGVAGATVQLWVYNASKGWIVTQETTTQHNGDYSFSGLTANGDYRVRFINYTPEQFVTSNAGNDAIDSDISQLIGNDGQVNYIGVTAGQKVVNVDAGLTSRGFEYEKIDAADAVSTVRGLGAELITNGGFQTHANAGQTGVWMYGNGTLSGWTSTSNAPIELQTGNYGTGNAAGNAIVELDSYKGSIDGIKQTVTVTDAGTYQLSFDYGLRENNYAGEQWWADSASNGFKVLIDGNLVQLVGLGADSGYKSGFQHRTFDVQLSAGQHTIQFIEDGYDPATADDGSGAELDNVSLKKVNLTQDTGNVSGTFYFDGDRDGHQDSNEGGLGGRTVYLLDIYGNFMKDAKGAYVTTETDSDGDYSFTGLKPSPYRVAFEDTMSNLEFAGANGTSMNGKPVFITDGFRINAGVEVKGVDGGMVGLTTSSTIEVCENGTFVKDFDTSCQLISEDVYFMVDQPICARVGMTSFNENQVNGWNNATTNAMQYRVYLDAPATSDLTLHRARDRRSGQGRAQPGRLCAGWLRLSDQPVERDQRAAV